MLKIVANIIAPSLTYIFNLSLSTGIFIDDWKNARVNSIYKEGSRRNMGNYRPISILPILSKVFEKEVFRQIKGDRELVHAATQWANIVDEHA
jgi:hypothetical protein